MAGFYFETRKPGHFFGSGHVAIEFSIPFYFEVANLCTSILRLKLVGKIRPELVQTRMSVLGNQSVLYLVRIEKVFLRQKDWDSKLFIVETTCLESDNPEIKAGEQCSWIQSLEFKTNLPHIKAFVGTAHGFYLPNNPEALNRFVTQDVYERAISNKNPLQGKKLRLECFPRKNANTGKDFTVHAWSL